MGLVRFFIDADIRLSELIDRVLPRRLREDGNRIFIVEFLRRAVRPGDLV